MASPRLQWSGDRLIKSFLKFANPGLFCLFSFFSHSNSNDKYTTEKRVDGVLGTRTRASGWKVQMNPLSYGGTHKIFIFFIGAAPGHKLRFSWAGSVKYGLRPQFIQVRFLQIIHLCKNDELIRSKMSVPTLMLGW